MKTATVYYLDDNGKWVVDGHIKLEAGQMTADSLGSSRIMDSTFAWGDRSYSKADGEAFLDILPNAVNGSYVAVRVEDDTPQAYAKRRPVEKEGYHSVPKLLRILKAQEREEANKG